MRLRQKSPSFLICIFAFLVCLLTPAYALQENKASNVESTDSSFQKNVVPPKDQPPISELKPASLEKKEQLSALIDEKKARVFYALGLRYFSQGNYREAWVAFNIAAQIYPQYKKLNYYLELTKERLTEEEQKELEYKKEFYEAVKDKYVNSSYAAGRYAMQYARYQDAIDRFEEVLQLEPQHQGARENLIRATLMLARQQRQSQEKQIAFIKNSKIAKINLIELAKQTQMAASYQQADELFKNNWSQEALNKFEGILEENPGYKDVEQRVADVRLSLLAQNRQTKGAPYTLGPGDVLDVNVFNHPELSGIVTVEPGGEIILPLIRGAVQVEGLSKDEAARKIEEMLVKYIQNPEVQVVITEYNSKKWYILGEVGLRGEYPLGRTRLTLMEALYQAGLPIETTAALWRVTLIKPHRTQPYYKTINVADILYKGKMQDNVIIEPGDIIYVPQTVLNKVTTLLGLIVAPITTVKEGFQDVQDTADAIRDVTPISAIFKPKK